MGMKVCYLANAASPHAVRWVNYFAEHGCKVDLITWHAPRDRAEICPDVEIHRLLFPPHYLGLCGALLEIVWLLRKIHPDIIHAHYIGTFGVLAGLYSRFSGFRPVVLTAWGSDLLVDAKTWKKCLMKYALQRVDWTTCNAEHIREVLLEMGAEPDKVSLISFGVDVDRFSPSVSGERIRNRLGVGGSPVVISMRNLRPLYDVECLIRAMPLVLRDVPDTRFVIAGEGRERSRLESVAKSLHVSDSVSFVGFIPDSEVPEYLASSDVYVSTALSDGWSASTSEAMACGLPVVITDFGDNRRWVEDGVNGFVVPSRDPQTLASRVVHLLRHERDRIEFGRVNRRVIEMRNNLHTEMGKMLQLYQKLVRECRKPGR